MLTRAGLRAGGTGSKINNVDAFEINKTIIATGARDVKLILRRFQRNKS